MTEPRSLARRLFEPTEIGVMAPATKALSYLLLIGWSLVVLFPLYWLAITSLKLDCPAKSAASAITCAPGRVEGIAERTTGTRSSPRPSSVSVPIS